MQIYNRKRELQDWIRRKLGAPILKAVPLAAEQMDDCIDEACLYAGEFMGGTANKEELAIIFTKPSNLDTPLLSTSDNRLIKNSDYTNNPTATTSNISAGSGSIMIYNQEYQLPRNVLAVTDLINGGGGNPGGNNQGSSNDDQSILDVAVMNSAFGGLGLGGLGGLGGGTVSMSTASGLFVPSTAPGFGNFGNRGGSRAAGGGIDLISFTLGMQYLEMVHQMFTVKLRMSFLAAERKVRFSPAPPSAGFCVIGVWARVDDEWLYENLWVRKYSLAKCMKQIAFNGMLYKGVKMPGNVEFNWDFYNDQADKQIEILEKEILDNKFGEPPLWFIG